MACQKSFYYPVLLRLGHAEHEISELTAAFTKFDQDGNCVLDEKEQEQMRQDLEAERVSPAGCWRGSVRKLLTLLSLSTCPEHKHKLKTL